MQQRARRRIGVAALAAALISSTITALPAYAVQGEDATSSAYGFAAKITVGDSVRGCSGVLVGPSWILTATSCLSTDGQPITAGAPPVTTKVVVGRPDLTATGVGHETTVTQLIPRADRDVTLAKLATPVADVAPIAFATTPAAASETLTVAGFGRTADEWVPNHLHATTYVAQTITDTTFTMTPAGTGAAICKGDAGGPTWRTVNGTPQLVAIHKASWQHGCLDVTETRDGVTETRVDGLGEWLTQSTVPTAAEPGVTSTDLALHFGIGPIPTPASGARIGQPATVTFTSPAADAGNVVGYRFGVGAAGGNPATTAWAPATQEGTASAVLTPPAAASTLAVTAVRADNTASATTLVVFNASPATTTTRVAGDATGDGRSDLTTLSDIGDGKSVLWRWNSTSDGGLGRSIAPQGIATTYPTATTKTAQGDFDGDGRADIAVFTQSGSDVVLSVQRSDGNLLLGGQSKTLAGWEIAKMVLVVGNFDADSGNRDDITVFYDHGGYVFTERVLLATGNPGAPTFADPAIWFTQPASGVASMANMKVFAGDFDGDHRADLGFLYGYSGCQTKLWLQYSSGDAFLFGALVWDSGAGNFCWDRSKPAVADFDGDGRADVSMLYTYDGCRSVVWTSYGNANRTVAAPGPTWEGVAPNWCGDQVELQPGDHDGDGKADLAAIVRCCGVYQAKIYTFQSTGRSFAGAVFRAEGSIGPAGTSSLVIDPGARYQIINVNSGKCLAVMGGDGTQVTQQACTTGTNMTFNLERTPSRLTVIHPVGAPASCLDIYDGSTSNEAAVQQWTCHKGSNQQFQLTVAGGNITPIVNIINEKSKLVLDVKFSGLNDGVVVWQYTPNNSTAQQFTLRRVG